MLAALADGRPPLPITRLAAIASPRSPASQALGVTIARNAGAGTVGVTIDGRGLRGLLPPSGPLDCGNSGHDHADAGRRPGRPSLCVHARRRRFAVAAPDAPRDGAADRDGRPLRGRDRAIGRRWQSTAAALHAAPLQPDVPSAQVKSAVLLAGLQTEGTTVVTEPAADPRPHRARAGGLRRAPGRGRAPHRGDGGADGCRGASSACPATCRRPRSRPSPPPRCPARTSPSTASA